MSLLPFVFCVQGAVKSGLLSMQFMSFAVSKWVCHLCSACAVCVCLFAVGEAFVFPLGMHEDVPFIELWSRDAAMATMPEGQD